MFKKLKTEDVKQKLLKDKLQYLRWKKICLRLNIMGI